MLECEVESDEILRVTWTVLAGLSRLFEDPCYGFRFLRSHRAEM